MNALIIAGSGCGAVAYFGVIVLWVRVCNLERGEK